MKDGIKLLSEDLLSILTKAEDNKIYGSVEIYFEGGKVTQVTQRIIRKIHQKEEKKVNSQNRAYPHVTTAGSQKEL